MDTVPKSKRYLIKKLTEQDPSLSIDELKGKTILALTRMKDDQKLQLTEKIEPVDEGDEFEYKTFFQYCGLNN
jgi:hypothetical protein